MIGGQLARLNGVPYRSSNANASTSVDAQAAYESQVSLWSAVMSHANIVLHGAGWLEGGLVASFEKMVIDADTIQMITEVMEPVEVTNEAIGMAAMADVGPGGHFFGTQHTLERYETAFYASDGVGLEQFRELAGSRKRGCRRARPRGLPEASSSHGKRRRSIRPSPRNLPRLWRARREEILAP